MKLRGISKSAILDKSKIEYGLVKVSRVPRRPVDVCSGTTEAERRLQDVRWTSALERPKRSGEDEA